MITGQLNQFQTAAARSEGVTRICVRNHNRFFRRVCVESRSQNCAGRGRDRAGICGRRLRVGNGVRVQRRLRQVRIILLLFDKPKAEQNDANRNNNNASSVHEKSVNMLRCDAEFVLRHRVMTAIAPRLTAADTFRRQCASHQSAVRMNRFNRVL